jgi:phage gp36-like protein
MPYASQAKIELAAGGAVRLRDLADWDGDQAVDAAVIAEAQAAADGWIDSYLRMRFATPIAAPSTTLVRIAAEEAVYWMLERRGMAGPQDVESRKRREAWLRDCASGAVRPDEPLPAQSTAVQSAWVDDPGRAVSRDGLKGGVW